MGWRGLLEPGVQGNYDPQTWRGVTPVVPAKAPPQTPYRDVNESVAPTALPAGGFRASDPYGDGGAPKLGSGVPTQPQINGLDANKIAMGSNDGAGGGFTTGKGVSYNVNDTSQPGVSRVTATGQKPLYTNINPKDAVGGLKDQMVGGDPTEGLTRIANANAIRQSMIDSQPQGNSGIIRDTSAADSEATFARWAREALDSKIANAPALTRGDQARLSALVSMRNADVQADTAGRGQDIGMMSHMQGIDAQGRNALNAAELNAASHLRGVGLQTQAQRDIAGIRNQGMLDAENARQGGPLAQAQVAHLQSQTKNLDAQTAAGKVDPYLPIYLKLLETGALDEKNPQHAKINSYYMGLMANHAAGQAQGMNSPEAANIYAAVKAGKMSREDAKRALSALEGKYAEGGQVETPEQLMARIAAKYGTAPAPQPAPQQATRQPAPAPQPVAQNRGLSIGSAIGSIQERGRQLREVAGYAEGGPIQVGGRQVIGVGDGKSDSLPAQIDGEHPAALSTGEFVMPIEAVRYFGLAKLNKMVAESRKGQ